MKSVKNIFYFIMFVAFLFLSLSPNVTFAAWNKLEYVALGDSLAAGFLNEPDENGNRIGKGYPVFIKEGIESQTDYEVGLRNFGIGGFRTIDVLNQIWDDANNITFSIENADLITIGIGANDVLRAVDLEKLNPENMAEIIGDARAAIEQVKTNLNMIFDEISDMNGEVPIYVLGYYNALPYKEDVQEQIILMINLLNQTIKNVTEERGGIFVPTFDAFAGKHEIYLPNPQDIHPTEEGYQVIANLFLEKIVPALPPIEYKIHWISGNSKPENKNIEENSYYLDVKTGDVYKGEQGLWEKIGNIITDNGTAESSWLKDAKDPEIFAGKPGDLFFHTESKQVYVMEDNGWRQLAILEMEDNEPPEEPKDPPSEDDLEEIDLAKPEESVNLPVFNEKPCTCEKQAISTDMKIKSETAQKQGGTLPDTATNTMLYIMLGCGLFIVGLMLRTKGRSKRMQE